MISFVRSSNAQETVARRNQGVQERRVRLMQLGQRAYLCQVFQRRLSLSLEPDEREEEGNNNNSHDEIPGTLLLRSLPEMELRQYLAQSESYPSRADLARAFDDFANHVLHNNTSIHTLELSQDIQDILQDINNGESLTNLLSGLRNLRHLSIGTLTLVLLLCFVENCSTIQSLETTCFHFDAPEEDVVMAELLSGWKSLEKLVWHTSSYRRAAQIEMIRRAVPSLKNLRTIHLMHSGLKEFHPFEALRFLQLCPQLQELRLCNWKLLPPACTVLGTGLARHEALQKLVLERCEINAIGWEFLIMCLQTNTVLREFSFPESRIVRSTYAAGAGSTTYPTRLVWEQLAVLLQDYNVTLQRVENDTLTARVRRLLELNRSNLRTRWEDHDVVAAKLAPRVLAMASNSPRFVYFLLRNNVETLLTSSQRPNNNQSNIPDPNEQGA